MPVYNGSEHVGEAIRSLLAQTFRDFELIICDNASTDGTQSICRGLAECDPRIRYYRNSCNMGAAANYNRTFQFACGEYFKWAAHDDRCAPEYLERCVEELDRSPSSVVLCYPRCKLIDWESRILRDYDEDLDLREANPSQRLLHLLTKSHWCHPVLGLIRAEALRSTRLIGRFAGSDNALLAELALRGEFHELPERLFYRRIRNGGSPSLQQPTPEHIEVWFDPGKNRGPALPHSRLIREHVRAISRSRIGKLEKLRCLHVLWRGRHARRWRWPDLRSEWIRAFRKGTWDRWTVHAIRRSQHYIPHRLWAFASGLRKRDWSRVGLAVAKNSRENQEALLRFVAESLSRRADTSARQLLFEWAKGSSESRRRAAREALLHLPAGRS
jgi:glycosyltransferase involved in cell wall biosynthesis